MAAPTPILAYGSTDLWLESLTITENLNDLDTFDAVYHSGSESSLRAGGTAPDASGFTIDSCRSEMNGEDWIHYVTGSGIAHGKAQRTIAEEENPNEEGFDTARRTVLTTNKRAITLGANFGVGSMFCVGVSARRHPVYTSWYFLDAQFKGTLGSKAIKLRVGHASREIYKENHAVLLPGGWDTPQKSELMMPRPTLTLSYVETRLRTLRIPAAQQPQIAPPVLIGYRFQVAPADVVHHWPNGWVFVGSDTEVIAGTNVCFVQDNYIYNEKYTF